MSGLSHLDVPGLNVPLPEGSPYPSRVPTPDHSRAPSPDPMSHVDPIQPTYVNNFTRMLAFMNENHTQFQEQITRAISLLTASRDMTSILPGVPGGSSVKLRNPCTFNG